MNQQAHAYQVNTAIRALLISLCFCASTISRWVNLDVIVMLCAFLFVIMTLHCNLSYIIKYSAIIAAAGLAIVGTWVIEENDIWLSELQKHSAYHGSLPLLVGYYLLFLIALELGDRAFTRKQKRTLQLHIMYEQTNALQLFLDIFGILFFGVTVLMCVRLLPHPYFKVHMDRFQYQRVYIQGIWSKIAAYYYYFIPLLLMNWHRGRQKKLTICTMTLYVLYMFLQGEKYGGYMTLMLYALLYFIPTMPKEKKKKLWKILFVIIIVFVLAAGAIVLQYSVLYKNVGAVEHLFERVAQQGQLWWNIYGIRGYKRPQIQEVSDELDAYTDMNSLTPYYGIYKMMYLSAPEIIVSRKIASGSAYTESTAASLYYYFGAIALPLFAVFIGLFFSWLATRYTQSIYGSYIIEAMLITRLFQMGRGFFSMSHYEYVFAKDTLFTIIVWGVCVVIREHLAKRSRI